MPLYRPSPRENPYGCALGFEEPGENRGFSTFFSTVVENFGGRPYGAAGEATVAHDFTPDKGNSDTPAGRLTPAAAVRYYLSFSAFIRPLQGI